MEKSIYIGKNKEDLLNLALYELNVNKEDIIFIEKEIKTGLFKTKKIELSIFKERYRARISKYNKKYIKRHVY